MHCWHAHSTQEPVVACQSVSHWLPVALAVAEHGRQRARHPPFKDASMRSRLHFPLSSNLLSSDTEPPGAPAGLPRWAVASSKTCELLVPAGGAQCHESANVLPTR